MSLKAAFLAGLIALLAGPILAQAPAPFPSKQLHFIVPFPAGGTLDVLARTVGNEIGPALGQRIVVENRPGASGVLGAELVALGPGRWPCSGDRLQHAGDVAGHAQRLAF